MSEFKAFIAFCLICTALILLSLTFKSLGGDKRGGLIITCLLLAASVSIIGMICRQHK